MWWRFVVFCFLVSFILFVVLNYLHDRPVIHFKFFKRCCDDENDQVVYEKFVNNYLKERLVAFEFEASNDTFVPDDVDMEEVMEIMREKVNVHDPISRRLVESFEEAFSSTVKNELYEDNFEEFGEKLNNDKNEVTDIEKDEIDVFVPIERKTSEGDNGEFDSEKLGVNTSTINDSLNEIVTRYP